MASPGRRRAEHHLRTHRLTSQRSSSPCGRGLPACREVEPSSSQMRACCWRAAQLLLMGKLLLVASP